MYVMSCLLQQKGGAEDSATQELQCYLMSATVAVTLLFASISAAASALLTMVPYATSATSFPPLLTTPLPICGPETSPVYRPFGGLHLPTTHFLAKQGACPEGPDMQCKSLDNKAARTTSGLSNQAMSTRLSSPVRRCNYP